MMTQVDRVLLAAPRSFCAGVEMAIKALAWMVRMFDPPVYCYHEIVHNRVVVERFRQAGVVFVDDIEDVPPGAPVMLSAHGSAPEVVRAARYRSHVVVDAVCPLVKKVHHEVKQRSDKGHTVVYVGHATHDEAIGTLAVSPEATHLVESPADVAALDQVQGPVAFLAQTTLGLDDWQETLDATRERFGDVWLPGRSDLCFATTNRQAAVKAMTPRCDSVVVIGSASSSNTLSLVNVARATAPRRVIRVNGLDELPSDLEGTVGVTAGASAPEDVVQSVLAQLAPRDGIEVVDVTTEDEYFPPPRELRDLLRSVGAERLLDDDRSVAASDVLRDLEHRPPGLVPELEDPGAARALATEQLAGCSPAVDRQMAEVVDQEIADPWLRQAIGYHLGWRDEQFELVAGPEGGRPGGKKLRATLAMLAYRAAAGRSGGPDPDAPTGRPEDSGPDVPFAAAVELVHNWSLIHDDIEDGDRTRRGRPALWTICGEAQAINVGDCVYALAFRCLARLRDRGIAEPQIAELASQLSRTGVELTVGQMRDMAFETRPKVSQDDYLEMIGGKTGALLRCATYGGALLGSGDPAEAQAFGEFGRQLGLAFQIRDDILGIWGTGSDTGKPVGADIRRRKKSFPIVLAVERADPSDGNRLRRLYADDSPITPADESYVREVLDRYGAYESAQQAARRHRQQAMAALAAAAALAARAPQGPAPPGTAARASSGAPPRPYFTVLRALADFVTERTY